MQPFIYGAPPPLPVSPEVPESYGAPNIYNASLGGPPPWKEAPKVQPNMFDASLGVYSPQPNVYSPQPAVVYTATRDSFKIAPGKNSGLTSPELDVQVPNSPAPAYELPTKDPESASNGGRTLWSLRAPVSRQGP